MSETSSNQYLAFEHPFSWVLVCALLLGCAALMFWSLFRERRILGSKTIFLFTALRAIVLLGLAWMLLAPTSVIEKETTTPKTVAVIADMSPSMQTLDPQGTADDWRWATMGVLSSEQSQATDVAALDRATAAAGILHQHLETASRELQLSHNLTATNSRLAIASRAVESARENLEELSSELSDGLRSRENMALLSRLQDLLDSPELDSLISLTRSLQRNVAPQDTHWREGVSDLVARSATILRVFEELSARVTDSRSLDEVLDDQQIAIFQNQSRSQRLRAYLEKIARGELANHTKKAELYWAGFGEKTHQEKDAQSIISSLSNLDDAESTTSQTDISSVLQHVEQLNQSQPVAATFVFSDVAHNSADSVVPTELAGRLSDVPVYVIPMGNQSRLRDIDLVSTSAPSVAMRNDDVVIEANLEIFDCAGETVLVQLLRDGEVLDFRNVKIDAASASRVIRFDQRVSEIGLTTFQLAVQPVNDESTIENNFSVVEINVTRSDIQLLLADELPRWEFGYLAQLFRRDPKIALDELLYHPRMLATGRRQPSQALPTTVDQWNEYDVVILGDILPEHFPDTSQQALLQYLRERGGTAILIAGNQAMPHGFVDHPLASALPVRPLSGQPHSGDFAFQVTEEGKSHVALMIGETESATRDAWEFVNQFSPLHQVSSWRSPLPTAHSLLNAVPRSSGNGIFENGNDSSNASTFLCWQPVGRGRIVYLAGPDTYRLRFLRGDQLHHRFWGQLIRWAIAADLASGNQLVRIRTNKTLFDVDESVQVEVQLLDQSGAPQKIDPTDINALHLCLTNQENQQTLPLRPDPDRPGYYRANISALDAGVYQVSPAGSAVNALAAYADADTGAAIASFTVKKSLPQELIDTRCNRALAAQIAELSGGQVISPAAVGEILELTDLDPIVTTSVSREALWIRWRYLWLIFGCLQLEWIVRKWKGLS